MRPTYSNSHNRNRVRIDTRPQGSDAVQAGMRNIHRDTRGNVIGGRTAEGERLGTANRNGGRAYSATPRLDAGVQTPRLDAMSGAPVPGGGGLHPRGQPSRSWQDPATGGMPPVRGRLDAIGWTGGEIPGRYSGQPGIPPTPTKDPTRGGEYQLGIPSGPYQNIGEIAEPETMIEPAEPPAAPESFAQRATRRRRESAASGAFGPVAQRRERGASENLAARQALFEEMQGIGGDISGRGGEFRERARALGVDDAGWSAALARLEGREPEPAGRAMAATPAETPPAPAEPIEEPRISSPPGRSLDEIQAGVRERLAATKQILGESNSPMPRGWQTPPAAGLPAPTAEGAGANVPASSVTARGIPQPARLPTAPPMANQPAPPPVAAPPLPALQDPPAVASQRATPAPSNPDRMRRSTREQPRAWRDAVDFRGDGLFEPERDAIAAARNERVQQRRDARATTRDERLTAAKRKSDAADAASRGARAEREEQYDEMWRGSAAGAIRKTTGRAASAVGRGVGRASRAAFAWLQTPAV